LTASETTRKNLINVNAKKDEPLANNFSEKHFIRHCCWAGKERERDGYMRESEKEMADKCREDNFIEI